MFPLFHIGLPLGVSEIPYIRKRFKMNRLALSIGAITPDLVDKFLLFTGFGPGRFICHTLLFLFGSALVVLLGTKLYYAKSSIKSEDNYIIPVSYFIGVLFHLILDLPGVPLFYPFIPYDLTSEGNELVIWITRLFTNPIVIFTELTGAVLIVIIILKYRLYTLKEMWHYLIFNQ